ncbi:hypothetical protein CK203_060104 [Vitis vinifera]|uniref:Uncharacterized protein n=1 Tax=Vitis vinifera TaxID=29760 RepID=A0A438GGF7_VITVI|nr:hypothetical protein CK203_060104 [Vitis vinifera]
MLLPRILSATKYYGENGDPKGERAWDIKRLNNIPQQTKEIPYAQPSNGFTNKRVNRLVSREDGSGVDSCPAGVCPVDWCSINWCALISVLRWE